MPDTERQDVFVPLLLVPSILLASNVRSSSNTNSLLPSPIPPFPPEEDPDVVGKPDAIYASQQVEGGVTWHWRARCCACEGLDWCWDVGLVGEEEQEVVLTLTSLFRWSIFGRRWEIFFGFGSWIMIFIRSLFD